VSVRVPTEADVQKLIVAYLRLHGLTVLETSRRRRRCRCGRWPAGGDGADKGVPDLLVWLAGRGSWLGVEVKGQKTRLSPEQRVLAARGMVVVVRTPEEALAAVRERGF
jgi:hypothetical protein